MLVICKCNLIINTRKAQWVSIIHVLCQRCGTWINPFAIYDKGRKVK